MEVPVGEDSESVVGEEGVAVGDTVPERLFTKHLARVSVTILDLIGRHLGQSDLLFNV